MRLSWRWVYCVGVVFLGSNNIVSTFGNVLKHSLLDDGDGKSGKRYIGVVRHD